jgi:transposase InsO family protein
LWAPQSNRYLAVVMNRCSRRIVGWAFGRQKNVVLTLRALNHAVGNRRPPPGLIFHTDRGIEYAANAFRERLAQLSITQSMNRPGKVTDNAFMESFFHSMKSETIHGCTVPRMARCCLFCAAISRSTTTVESIHS